MCDSTGTGGDQCSSFYPGLCVGGPPNACCIILGDEECCTAWIGEYLAAGSVEQAKKNDSFSAGVGFIGWVLTDIGKEWAKAGLAAGDVVSKINGLPVRAEMLAELPLVKSSVRFTVYRPSTKAGFSVTVTGAGAHK